MKTHLCQLYIPWMMVELLKSPADYLFSITYNYFHSYSTLTFVVFYNFL